MEAVGIGRLYSGDVAGVYRLSGANIAAHLAMLAFIGASVALYEAVRSGSRGLGVWNILALSNLFILVETGTRGPLIALVPMIAVFLASGVLQAFRRGLVQAVSLLVPVGAGAALLFMKFETYLMRQSEKGLSGREYAWVYFWEKTQETPLFGHGLGRVLTANDGSLYSGFLVPHNEYLRFMYDSGMIGALVLFAAIAWVLAAVAKRLAGWERWMFGAFIVGFCIFTFTDNTLSTIQITAPLCCFINGLYLTSRGKSEERRNVNGENESAGRRFVIE